MHEPARMEDWESEDFPARRIASLCGGDTALFLLAAKYYRSVRSNEGIDTLRQLLKQIIDELEDLFFDEDENVFEVDLPAEGNTQREALQLIAELDALLGASNIAYMTWVHALDGLIVRRVQQ
jgi:hypothetical protein